MALLIIIWIALMGSFSVRMTVLGAVISAGCVYFYSRMLPFPQITNINLFRLALYPVFLLVQVYVSAFAVMKIIITGAAVDTIQIKTGITNPFLRTLLANSITLIPGSISLELRDDTITVLRLLEKNPKNQNAEKAGRALQNRLEKMLLKMER